MKKQRILALLCAAAVLAGLVLPRQPARAASAPTVYLLAANDKWCDLPGGLQPVQVNGVIYIPYMTFDKALAGVDLGISYSLNMDQDPRLVLSFSDLSLTFKVKMGICQDRDGNIMGFQAVMRNGAVYIPASAVCNYFGLSYSYLPTADRGTLIRVKNGSAYLNDSTFLNSTTLGMTYRYNNIIKDLEPAPTPTPSPTAPPTQAPVPTPSPTATARPSVSAPPSTSSPQPTESQAPEEPTDRSDVALYLSVDASQADGDILDLFQEEVLFLFSPDALADQAGLVRAAAAKGHGLGLLVEADSLEDALAQLEKGNDLLTHIARQRTRIVSAPEALREGLADQGWACWSPDVTGTGAGAVLRALEGREGSARVALSASPTTIAQVLRQVRQDGYDLHQGLETDL